MQIQDKIIEHLNSNDGKVYVYLSKDKDNLNSIRLNTNNGVDFSKTTTKFLVLYPLGVGNISGEIHGVYYDDDSTTNMFIQEKITMGIDSFIKSVNVETKEINEV